MRVARPWVVFGSLIVALFIGCGEGGGRSNPSTGTLSIALTDTATTRFNAVYVTIDEVQVNRKAGTEGNSGWTTVATPGQTHNLLKLVNGMTALLGDGDLEAGAYRQVRLILGSRPESGTNLSGEPHPFANYVILNDGSDTVAELTIPSGMQTGIKLVHPFQVPEDAVTELLLDFDACRSVVETGSGRYLMKPVIRVIDAGAKRTVSGEVFDAATASSLTGVLVSAQVSDGLSAGVVRSTLTSGEGGEEGQYSLILSPAQEYRIVAFSDRKVAEGGSMTMHAPACTVHTAADAGDAILDLALERGEYGTITGEVAVEGAVDADHPPVVTIGFYGTLDCGYAEIYSLVRSPDPDAGRIEFSADLPAGVYDVVASADGFAAVTAAEVSIASAEPATVSLTLHP